MGEKRSLNLASHLRTQARQSAADTKWLHAAVKEEGGCTAVGKRKHRFKPSRLKLLPLVVAGAYALFMGVSHQSSMSSALERQEELLSEQEALQHQLEYHEHELDFIGSDEYVEQEARARLGWLKPGETKYMDSSASNQPREKVSVEPTPTPSVPGPRRTERPAAVPTQTRAAVPSSSSPQPSITAAPEKSVSASTSASQAPSSAQPASSSTPKNIG